MDAIELAIWQYLNLPTDDIDGSHPVCMTLNELIELIKHYESIRTSTDNRQV